MSGEMIGSLIPWLITVIIIIAVVAYLLSWLYYRSTRETAFVRTGLGGEKVVINGGALVLPIIHEVTPVNLNVVRIPAAMQRESSVISRDRMRVDVEAEFFVRVIQERKAVSDAASTLGRRTMEPDKLAELLSGKFVGVLRSVASELTLDQMHENRGKLLTMVEERARAALARNGLELESVAITDLDQTDLEYFNPANRFDAEGMTQLIETIEARRKLRNDIEQSSMVAIRARNLEAEKEALKLEQESENSRLNQELELETMRAEQKASIEKARVANEAEAEQARIDNERLTREKEIKQKSTLDAAELTAREEIEKARIAHERALEQERIDREHQVRARQIKQRHNIGHVEITTNEDLERARIASDRGLDEARIQKERELRQLEVERDMALELAEIERHINVLKKRSEEESARVDSENARARAVEAEEQVKTAREKEIAERTAAIGKLIADKDAEVSKITAEAEKVTAAVAAEAQRLRNEAENVLSGDARTGLLRDKLIERLEGIIRESAKPMEKIEGIRILHVDGLGDATGNPRSPTDEVIQSVLRYRAQAPLIDEMMKEVGVSNPNVASGLGDIFKTSRDAQSLAREVENAQKPGEDDKEGKKPSKT